MTDITLPKLSQTGTNEWADVEDNDVAIRDVVNGQLDNGNLSASAGIAFSKLAALATGEFIFGSAGTPTSGAMSGDATISAAGALTVAATIKDATGVTDGSTTRRDYAEVLTEETTTSTSYTDLATAGPSVAVTVPSGGLVALYAEAEVKNTGSNNTVVGLFEATDMASAQQIIARTSATYLVKKTTPGDATGADGGGFEEFGGWLIFPATAGARTYTLKYKVAAGTGSFKNRKLWVVTLGGF